MTTRGACSLVLVLPFLTCCRSLSDIDVEYRECVRPQAPYVEQFDEDNQGLFDRCWRADNVTGEKLLARRKLVVGESDLIIGYSDGQMAAVPWDGDPPALLRRIDGDFVLATKVEVTSGTQSNFCGLDDADTAGILIRSADLEGNPDHRASFLVRPYFASEATRAEDCVDNAEHPPAASAEARSGLNSEAATVNGIGADGEADIAVCRIGGHLVYYYRRSLSPEQPWQPEDWKPLPNRTDVIGDGPVDVGLTTTLSTHGYDLHVQGHFNWVALLHDQGDLDECGGLLEDFPEPASD